MVKMANNIKSPACNPRPSPFQNTTKAPKRDGNSTHCCSDEGAEALIKGNGAHSSKSCRNYTKCCSDKGVVPAMGGRGGDFRAFGSRVHYN